ncbi:MAG: InlB B-repeat-containing protein [Fibrobacterota bacterium]
MKKILTAVISILLLSFMSTTVFAQTADFVDSHDDEVITGWTSQGNRTWSEQNGAVVPQNGSTDQGFLISDFEPTSDGVIEVDIEADQWNGHGGGIIVRWSSPQSYYFISVRPGNLWDNFIKFCKNTTVADNGLTVASQFSMNTNFTLRVEMEGSTFRFYIDGELQGEITDSDHASGGFGYAYGPVWNSYTSFEEIRWWNQGSAEYELSVAVDGNGSVEPEGGNYPEGTEVELVATADEGWAFSHWSGDIEGTENPAVVVMDSEKSVTAHFVQTTHMVNIMTEGNGTVTPETGVYPENTELTLEATADEGWRFSHWSGDIEGTENPASVLVDGEKFIEAHFEQITHELTILTEGTGTVTPESGTFPHGDEVEVTATAGDGWIFSTWSGDIEGSTNPAVVVMDDSKTITATFVQNSVELTVTVDGNGSVSPENATVPEGSTVEITATADEGYVFDHWSGDITGTENPISVVMDTDKQIQAHFVEYVPQEYTLTVQVDGNGSVTPESGTFLEGTEVEMVATADEGWVFSHWEGDIEGSDNPAVFTINSDMSATAVFNLDNQEIPNSQKVAISARLFDHNGQPIGSDSPENVDVIINLYAQETEGEVLYTEEFLESAGQAIVVEDGYLVARMGEGATIDNLIDIISANDDLWVEIVAEGNALPRVPITAAPYSLR